MALVALVVGFGQQIALAQPTGSTFEFYDVPASQQNEIQEEWATITEWLTETYRLSEPRLQFHIGLTEESVAELVSSATDQGGCGWGIDRRLILALSCEGRRESLLGWYVVYQGIGGSGDYVVEDGHLHRGPWWLSDALFKYLDSHFAASQGSNIGIERARRQLEAPSDWGVLESLEHRDEYGPADAATRGLGWLAVDWLVNEAGDNSYIEYMTRRGEHRTWEEAFRAFFGLAPAQFYSRFERARPEIQRFVTGATEAEADAADREGVWLSTPLYPGLNLIGWVEAPTPVEELLAAIPRIEIAFAWNATTNQWIAAWPRGGNLGGLTALRPGMGIWLRVSEGAPLRWERRATLASPPITNLTGVAELGVGNNFVAWAGWSGSFDPLGHDMVNVWQWDASMQEWLGPFSRDESGLQVAARTPHGQALAVEMKRGGLWRQSPAHWWPDRTSDTDWIESVQFWGDVSAEDRQRVSDRLTAVSMHFSELFGSTAAPAVHVAADDVAGADMYAALYGPNAEPYCGSAGRGEVLAIIHCRGGDAVELGVISHEFFHILQSERYLARFNTDGFVYVKSGGPAWIVEGWAEWAKFKFLDSIQPGAYAEARRYRTWAATQTEETLHDARLYLQSGMHFQLGLLAGERLVRRSGEAALLEYFSQLDVHGTPEAAFEATFGLTLDDFYEEFANWRAEGFPVQEDPN